MRVRRDSRNKESHHHIELSETTFDSTHSCRFKFRCGLYPEKRSSTYSGETALAGASGLPVTISAMARGQRSITQDVDEFFSKQETATASALSAFSLQVDEGRYARELLGRQIGPKDRRADWEDTAQNSNAGQPSTLRRWLKSATPHSHSMVAGGLPEMSYTTRLMPRTSLMMRFDTLASRLYGSSAQCAVMKSVVCTARSATTYS